VSNNPVLDATARHAAECNRRNPDPEKIAEAKKAITEAKLRRAVEVALAAFPPLSEETKASVAHLLTKGGE
jgi:hypothetical protein